MNIVSRIFLTITTLGVLFFLVFSTFNPNNTQKSNATTFPKENFGAFIVTNKNNIITATNEVQQAIKDKSIYGEYISSFSKILSTTNDYNIGESSIALSPGVHFIEDNEVNKNYTTLGEGFEILPKGPGSFIINNREKSKTIIFSLNTIVEVTLKNGDESATSLLLYPHTYLIFNQGRIPLVKNGDLLKISSIFTLGFFNEKIGGDGKKINTNFINLISLKDLEVANQIETITKFIKDHTKEEIKQFQTYIKKDFITLPGEAYIKKYFSLFLNNEKKIIFYKNNTIQDLVLLFHARDKDMGLIKRIKENEQILKNLDEEEANTLKNIIHYYYQQSLNTSLSASINFFTLLSTQEKSDDLESTILFYQIFQEYDFEPSSHLLEKISNIKKINDNNSEYLLFFFQNILTTQFENQEKYITQITKLLEQYVQLSLGFYRDTSSHIQKRTGLFKNSLVLEKISQIIKTTFFKAERNSAGLLERKEKIQIQRSQVKSLKESTDALNTFYLENKQFLDKNNSSDTNTIKIYVNFINEFAEFFDALDDYERYKSKYNSTTQNILDTQTINNNSQDDKTLSISRIYNYLKNFNGVSLEKIHIQIHNYDYCINQSNEESELLDAYCYDVKNFDIQGNTLDFRLFPFENNKIENIILNGGEKKGSYKLDILKDELDEKLKQASSLADKSKYDFQNFFINTFASIQESKEKEIYENDEGDILNESKTIKAFKRTKLLGEEGDFANLISFLNIKYNDIIVKDDYSINIKNSQFETNFNICENKDCESDYKMFAGELKADYLFTSKHSFTNIEIYFIDTNNKKEKKYLLSGNPLYIIGDIHVKDIETEIKYILSEFQIIESIRTQIQNTLNISNIELKFYTSNKRIKFATKYKNKNLTIYQEPGNNTSIFYDGNNLTKNKVTQSEVTQILTTIK